MTKIYCKTQRGDIAIYVALIIVTVLLSAALLFSAALSRQARLSANVIQNERAFYAADSGIEAALYDLKDKIDSADTSPSRVTGTINYVGQKAAFTAQGTLTLTANQVTVQACVNSTGTFARASRQLVTGPASCEAN